MAKDGELILDKRKPYIRYIKLDLFDVMPVPEGKMKTSGLKKNKGGYIGKAPARNERRNKERTYRSVTLDFK